MIPEYLTVILSTIEAVGTAGKVDNWIHGRADLRLIFGNGLRYPVSTDCVHAYDVCMNIQSGGDGDDCYGDTDCDCDCDGDGDVDSETVGDGIYDTRRP